MGTLSSAARDLAVFSPVIREAAPYIAATTSLVKGAQSYGDQQKAQSLELAQLQQRQSANLQDAQERAALSRAELAAKNDAAERDRKAALKRAVARQRAQYGAQGISTTTGSSEAVLLGLFGSSEDDAAENQRSNVISLSAIDQDLAAQNRLNIIQRTQLKERQKLEKQSSIF